jgi:hypothetical protein
MPIASEFRRYSINEKDRFEILLNRLHGRPEEMVHHSHAVSGPSSYVIFIGHISEAFCGKRVPDYFAIHAAILPPPTWLTALKLPPGAMRLALFACDRYLGSE